MENQNLLDDFDDKDKVESSLNLWKYANKGDEILGIVKKIEPGNYSDRRITLTVGVDNEEMDVPEVVALNSKLAKAEVGDKVKIIYLGKEKSGKSKYSYDNFEVFIKKTVSA